MPKGSQNPLNRTKSSLLQSVFFPFLPPSSPFQFQSSATAGHKTGDSFLLIRQSIYFLFMGRKAVS